MGMTFQGWQLEIYLIDLFFVFHVSSANAFSILVEHIYAFLFAESTFVVSN